MSFEGRRSEVRNDFVHHLILSRVSMACRPASGLRSGILSPGLLMEAMRRAQARPKTTISRRELAPKMNETKFDNEFVDLGL